ncbi:MAG TPA: MSMEG_4193 family putative phosphomutase [Actinomycetota bacterium]|nr:MSMEG_4193 family putative phosphomutase [Actinomycetota bacterium]
MTTLVFVRHGLTSHTGHRLTGWHPGVSLSDEGRAQATAAARDLARVPIKAIYASPIDRTRETAAAIARDRGLDVQVREGLGEVHYGRWSNRSFKSLARTKLWEQVQRWPSSVRFPDGETLRETQARAVAEVEELQALHPRDTICCVTHADVIRLVAAHYAGVHIDLFQRLAVDPGSITVISIGERGPVLSMLNHRPVVER